jgi:uncharacterized membrane protein (DUF2068 family)
VFILSGFGLLHLLHGDTMAQFFVGQTTFLLILAIATFKDLVMKASFLQSSQLKQLSWAPSFLQDLSLFEGLALLMQKPWAKYFTLIVMASFIPVELWKLNEASALQKRLS